MSVRTGSFGYGGSEATYGPIGHGHGSGAGGYSAPRYFPGRSENPGAYAGSFARGAGGEYYSPVGGPAADSPEDACADGVCGAGGRRARGAAASGQDAGVQGCGGCFAEEDSSSGVMTYVGNGSGDYVTETTYRYVGGSGGDFSILSPRRLSMGKVFCCLSVVALVAATVCLVFWPTGPTTTMKFVKIPQPPDTPPVPEARPAPRSCLFWGDPHVSTFDNARPSFYGSGDFWIIKSPAVEIQGRYNGTRYTHGLATTSKIVVSGPFIGNIRIEVGSLQEGEIEVDGAKVCQEVGSTYSLDGFGMLEYNKEGKLVDEAQAMLPRRILHMKLPQGVEVTVYRWKNYVDLKISMVPPEDGEPFEGSCGNFNGDPSDDTTEAIFGRDGARVAPEELLFRDHAEVEFSPEMEGMLASDCAAETLLAAEMECRRILPTAQETTNTVNSCVFDICFGANEHALRTAKHFD